MAGLVEGIAGLKRTTGQHPGGIMVVPRNMDIHYITPMNHPADERDSTTVTTHFDIIPLMTGWLNLIYSA